MLAERAFEERMANGQVPATPFPNGVNCDVERARPTDEAPVRASEMLIGAAALLPAAISIAKEITQRIGRERDAA